MTDRNPLSDPAKLRSSFTDFLRTERPDLFPTGEAIAGSTPIEATTILALRFADGVLMAGDRRATEGFSIAARDMEKVFPTDSHSAVGVAGAAGPSMEMVRLFQTECEYYEKVEGEALSLAGKANHLGRLIRGNLPAAMQGLVVVPLFGGYDLGQGRGRIYRYDVTGGTYEETDYHATGSGGKDAKNTLKKLYSQPEDITGEQALRMAVEALADAAEEDVGTGGPDPVRGIYPTVYTITGTGVTEIPVGDVEQVARTILEERSAQASRRTP